MAFVVTWEDIKRNLDQLEKYRLSKDRREVRDYQDLILRGICFVVYKSNDRLEFGPSRFVGYKDNNLDIHKANESKDGRETNPVISEILGEEPIEDKQTEKEFQQFCARMGLTPKSTGSFGIKRKYWLVRR